ncbi:hypothetical protein [Zhongshania sp. BJYM1]|uniref:hypothetical protein n=1 Tax=Zhongshania aquatica TaxID=2965069 RepID=UPI0022B57ED7|nr:hypothetical protein [Marortus sp. BJYM1]
MRVSWTSQQGQKRRQNSDAAAIGYCGEYFIATLADAAEKHFDGHMLNGINNRGERLAQYWANSTTKTILESGSYLNTEQVIAQLADRQKTLRSDFLYDIASYGVLILNVRSGKLQWLYTGDCRIGVQSNGAKIDWINMPHRIESTEIYKRTGVEGRPIIADEQQVAQQTLTQSLNARRFTQPELIEADIAQDATVLAATDGFWCEHLFRGVALPELEDDASWLQMVHGTQSVQQSTDSTNFLSVTEDRE